MALTYVDMSSVIEIQVNCDSSYDHASNTLICWLAATIIITRHFVDDKEKRNYYYFFHSSRRKVGWKLKSFDSFMFCFLPYQERLTSHGGGIGLTSGSPASYTGHSASSGGRSSLSSSQSMHQPADFQPPYFPPPFHHPSTHQSPPQQQQQVSEESEIIIIIKLSVCCTLIVYCVCLTRHVMINI